MLKQTLCSLHLLRHSGVRCCSAAASTADGEFSLVDAQGRFFRWCMENDVRVNGATINLRPTDGRGVFATAAHRRGTTVVSVPLRTALSAATAAALPTVQRAKIPPYAAVRDVLLNASVSDTAVALQVHLALALAVERASGPASRFAPYFDVLPHPAVDEAAVAALHEGVLSEEDKEEYADHVRFFHGVLGRIADRWPAGGQRPPDPVLDWAWRTVLQRQHLLPEHGAPPTAFRRLGFVSWFLLRGDRSFAARMWDRLLRRGDDSGGSGDRRLVPTLVPVVDAMAHGPSGNATVEVAQRGSHGVCAEIQLLADVAKGEELVITFSRAHSLPMTLYRFGFVPL